MAELAPRKERDRCPDCGNARLHRHCPKENKQCNLLRCPRCTWTGDRPGRYSGFYQSDRRG